MRKIFILHGYSGTLKSTISSRSGLPFLDGTNTEYMELRQSLFKVDSSKTLYSTDLLMHMYFRIERFLKDNPGDVIINRSLIEYIYWTNTSDANVVLDPESVIRTEKLLFSSGEVHHIVMKNDSEKLFQKVKSTGKSSRDLFDYFKCQSNYVEMITKYIPESNLIKITDENLLTLMEGKIPANYYYSWLGDESEMSELIKTCMKSVAPYLPDPINLNKDFIKDHNIQSPYLEFTLSNDMRAHTSDYLRIYALYHFGGIYLDTDVELVKRFSLLDYASLPDVYVPKENKSMYPEAAIMIFKNKHDRRLKLVLDYLDSFITTGVTYKEVKLQVLPMTLIECGLLPTVSNSEYFIHHFNGHWIDNEVFIPEPSVRELVKLGRNWKLVTELTKSTRYVITSNPQDYGEYTNLALSEVGIKFINTKFS